MMRSMIEVRSKMMTAMSQIVAEIGADAVGSWGVSHVACTIFENMPTMILQVSGLLHKGQVYISLNESKDLYEIRLVGDEGNITETIEDIYFDMLGSMLDEKIERGTMTQEQYNEKIMNEIINLFSR